MLNNPSLPYRAIYRITASQRHFNPERSDPVAPSERHRLRPSRLPARLSPRHHHDRPRPAPCHSPAVPRPPSHGRPPAAPSRTSLLTTARRTGDSQTPPTVALTEAGYNRRTPPRPAERRQRSPRPRLGAGPCPGCAPRPCPAAYRPRLGSPCHLRGATVVCSLHLHDIKNLSETAALVSQCKPTARYLCVTDRHVKSPAQMDFHTDDFRPS